jgi:predicted permease
MRLWQDLRYAARLLRRTPGFTVTALLTLGLGIGANTAIFSLVDAVLLRPLPYPEPDRLAEVYMHYSGSGEGSDQEATGLVWETVRDHASTLDTAAYSFGTGVGLASSQGAEFVMQQRVSAGFFRVLGVQPLIGREFTAEEDHPGGPPLVVLGYPVWKRAFEGNRNVIGRTVLLRGEPHTVLGVMPNGFMTNARAEVWTPLHATQTGEGEGSNYGLVSRLKPGASWMQADTQLASITPAAVGNQRMRPGITVRLRAVPLQRAEGEDLRRPLLVLQVAVAVVLLIGCVNLAGLLMSRGAKRAREIATRLALGGGPADVLRPLFAESLLLAVGGGALGAALGLAAVRAFGPFVVKTLGVWQTIAIDGRVLGVTAGLSLLTVALFGLLPALQMVRVDIRPALAEGGGRGVAGGASHWPRQALVVAEIALGVVLLVSAGLLIRSFTYLNGLRLGFNPERVVTVSLPLQDARYTSSENVNRLVEQTLARIRELPGVEYAAVATTLPDERNLNLGVMPLDAPGIERRGRSTDASYVTPDYFETLRIPLLRGRVFTAADRAGSPPVAIVNEAFMTRLLHSKDAVGLHISMSNQPREIVGVVGDVQQHENWGGGGPLMTIPTVYIPVTQTSGPLFTLIHTWFSPKWIVRAHSQPRDIVAGLQDAIRAVDPMMPFTGVRSMNEIRSGALATQRLQMTLLGVLAGLALLLAAIGIYGLIASSVIQRTREMGIRMALGASTAQAVRTVALPGVALSIAGVVIGCALARGATQTLRHLVWGVTPGDPLTYAAVAIVLLLVAAAASLLPSLRVARLDPASTLREE